MAVEIRQTSAGDWLVVGIMGESNNRFDTKQKAIDFSRRKTSKRTRIVADKADSFRQEVIRQGDPPSAF